MELKHILKEINKYQRSIKNKGPLSDDQIRLDDDHNRIRLTYSSNAIEGNSLSLMDTKFLLEGKIAISDKPLVYIYEAAGHADAFDYVLEQARGGAFKVTEELIKKIHFLFYYRINYEEAGIYRKIQVKISDRDDILFPNHIELDSLMKNFVEEFDKLKDITHPMALAAYAHLRLVGIHPFVDGNGRTARLLTNAVLINQGYRPINIPPEDRYKYFQSIYKSQINNLNNDPSNNPFFKLIAYYELIALKEFCDFYEIELDDDIDQPYDYKLF
jgi:Fic family protein